jgi:glycosyltransferase involved in cell wall biosynthesis
MKFLFFSIVIPTYNFNGNGLNYLKKNLIMISNQIFKNFEVIISDDSENDDIKKLCDEWDKKINLKYYKNNRGDFKSHSPNVNNGIQKSNGQWIKILFQDDFLFDEKSLENQFNFIKQNENIKWFFTKFFHTFDGENLYNLYSPKWNSDIWSGNNTLGGPSGLTMRNENLPEFDNNLIWLMDCDFYQKMYIKYGEPLICNDITVVNRTSDDQLTTTIKNEIKINEHKIVNEKYGK